MLGRMGVKVQEIRSYLINGLFTDLSTAISAFMVAMGFSTTLAQGRDGSLYRTASEQACDISPAS
jgi:hypothetical protein